MSAEITAERLARFAPACDAQTLAPFLDRAARSYEINTSRRVRHWMAQLSAESGGFTRLVENLNYSAERLTQVWPSRFPNLTIAQRYSHNPQALAGVVYGTRGGNTSPADGWRYRGRGFTELTFHDNYAHMTTLTGINLVEFPDVAAQPQSASIIAGAFWKANGCNQVVDADPGEVAMTNVYARIKANEYDDVTQARRIVNGGTIGLDVAKTQLQRAALIWSD